MPLPPPPKRHGRVKPAYKMPLSGAQWRGLMHTLIWNREDLEATRAAGELTFEGLHRWMVDMLHIRGLDHEALQEALKAVRIAAPPYVNTGAGRD